MAIVLCECNGVCSHLCRMARSCEEFKMAGTVQDLIFKTFTIFSPFLSLFIIVIVIFATFISFFAIKGSTYKQEDSRRRKNSARKRFETSGSQPSYCLFQLTSLASFIIFCCFSISSYFLDYLFRLVCFCSSLCFLLDFFYFHFSPCEEYNYR